MTEKQNQQLLLVKKILDDAQICESAMDELKKIYWHEKQLLIAIPLLLSTAKTPEVIDSLNILKKYTIEHIEKLETNFPSISKVA